jgi:hypothetical protein
LLGVILTRDWFVELLQNKIFSYEDQTDLKNIDFIAIGGFSCLSNLFLDLSILRLLDLAASLITLLL